MIKKYNQFINESLLDELKGPTEEEIWNNLKDLSPNVMLVKSAKSGLLKGVKKALENGANIHASNDYAIKYAAEYGHLDIVKYLVEHGANIHADDDDALICAAMNGHLDVIKYLGECGANVRADNDDALISAVINNHIDVVKYLVEQGADIHAENDYALRCATENGHLDVVRYLVELGADIHNNNDYPLRYAAQYGHLDVVIYLEEQIKKEKLTEGLTDFLKGPTEEELWNGLKELEPNEMLVKSAKSNLLKGVKKAIELGADIHVNEDYTLRWSAKNGYLDIVKYLVENGADIHACSDNALRYAASNGHLDIVKFLVENGADIHAEKDQALRYAAHNGYLDIVKYLIEQGADLYSDNYYALNYAIYNNSNTDVIFYLKSQMKKEKLTESLTDYLKGPTIEEVWDIIKDETDEIRFFDKLNTFNITPQFYKLAKDKIYSFLNNKPNNSQITIFASLGLLDEVKQLVKIGGIKDNNYSIALCNASIYGHYDIVNFLLTETNADIHASYDGAVRYASSNGYLDIVKLLIKHGANIHEQDEAPLRLSSRKGHYDIVKFLLENGAKVLEYNNIFDPIEEAELQGYKNIVDLLKKYKKD